MIVMMLFWLFGVLFLVGLGLGIWALVRPQQSSAARTVLDERLARGEISVSEHRERLDALGPRRERSIGPIAIAFAAVGLIGLLAAGSSASVSMWEHMRDMMGGGGMMDGGMMGRGMMGGRTERSAPEPQEGSAEESIVADEFFFRPDEIRVAAGETVNLVLDNRGDAFHTLTIEELDFELRAAGGERIAGALEAPPPGSYEFICAVPGHADAGMVGTLVVEPA